MDFETHSQDMKKETRTQKVVKAWEKGFDFFCSINNISDPPSDTEPIKSFIRTELANARREGRKEALKETKGRKKLKKKKKKYFTVKEANMIESAMLAFQNELLFSNDEPTRNQASYQLSLLKNNFHLKKVDKYSYSRFVQRMIKKIDKISR